MVLSNPKSSERMLHNARFILKHWHGIRRTPKGWKTHRSAWLFECDAFDKETRQCTAHKDRPPICSDYPWYGGSPEANRLTGEPEKLASCSYWFDVPKADRPDWATPVRLRTR